MPNVYEPLPVSNRSKEMAPFLNTGAATSGCATVTAKVTVTSSQVSVTVVFPDETAAIVSTPPSTAADATVSSADEAETALP